MHPEEAIWKSLQCSCANPQGSLNLTEGFLKVVETLRKYYAMKLSFTIRVPDSFDNLNLVL